MKFEALDSKRHNRQDFDCGINSLNQYIANFANQDQKRDLSRTFVLADDAKIIGYYSISSHSVSRAFLPDNLKLAGYDDIPFILLGRLAVDKIYQGKGYGDALIFDAFQKTAELAENIGIFGVIVDSINEEATRFYEGFGFKQLSSNAKRLFLPTNVIVRQLRAV